MKKQLKTKLSLNKEVLARLNEEQMELISGGQAAADTTTAMIILEPDTGKACGGPRSVIVSKTCPPTGTCNCVCTD